MAIKETVFLLLVLMLPVAMMAKEPVKHSREIESLQNMSAGSFAKENDASNGKSLGEELKEDITKIKGTVHVVLRQLDELSAKARRCKGCPAGWVAHGDSCYYIDDSRRLVWSAARRECQKMGADLAVITSAQQQSFIFDLVKKQDKLTVWGVWIGLQQRAVSKFYWVDGTPLEGHYQNWYIGEPNNYRGAREDCGHMYGKQAGAGKAGAWNDLLCGHGGPRGLLCQKTI